jgi:pilus assembly protein Flp/PilA
MGNFRPAAGTEPMRRFFRTLKDDRGATAVEYGLILALVFLAMVAGVQAFASAAIEMWTDISEQVRRER